MKKTIVLVLLVCMVNYAAATIVEVKMETNYGDFTLELYPDLAPITVANFLDYTTSGFYDGLIFHRVVANFVIQGGGYDQNLVLQTPNNPIINESDNGLSNVRGTIAMARISQIDSAASQFFINTVDNLFLDPTAPGERNGYAVFGQVVDGMNVVDAIEAVPTSTQNNLSNVPVTNIVIESVYIIPEPTTLSLISLGSLTLLRRKRK